MKKQNENSHEGITWSEMGKQNVQAEKVYWFNIYTISNLRRLEALILILFPLQHMKRPPLQYMRVGVLRMAFLLRNVSGTFEKRAPGLSLYQSPCQ